MSHSDSIKRVVDILHALNNGKTVCISRWAQMYDVHPRTVRRDLELIKEIFGAFMTKEGECYRAYEKVLLDKILSATELMQLSNIVNILNLTKQTDDVSEQTRALIQKSKEVYAFKNKPFEQISNLDILRKLEHTITFRQKIHIRYATNQNDLMLDYEPYKILFLNENFYLVGVSHARFRVEFLRVSMIREVQVLGTTFTRAHDVVAFIESVQTPFALYELNSVVIRLRADKRITKYFLLKQYLPTQKIIEHYPNGDIQLEFTVTRYIEIEEFMLKWLPYVRVISPVGLKRHLRQVLERKMRDLN